MTRTPDRRPRKLVAGLLASALALAPVLTPILATPAQAFFGFGGRIVYDPRNHAENILSAARAMEQINNQILQLQNEAQMLLNDALNLASLPHSSLARLQEAVAETQRLLSEAGSLAFDVAAIEQAFTQDYGAAAGRGDFDAMIAGARQRWETSVAGFEDALRVQAGVVGNIEAARSQMEALVRESQGAVGALQAAQAGNQLLALQSAQLADLTAAIAAQNRAVALEAARATSAEAQARENLARFLDYGTGYTPGTARMFRN
ncbi:P-type conjugative transfer protein TrbJ [Amaricoccus sp.]|uniref:P-type conjugative transfer protein TrbJ n=1 Tax=Amaricoccus sp. TaxID=1872485 RepID=UPI002C163826|nr:P-type conjugative transfer protein TrbJ [Amaricoccus sp.]HMQ92327.1 P-type conjugative transfer protein TrbJ [Amaricoccus sp.]HMR36995.1 P-type conjugative transfer protein TrbJ [Paracoccus sp. (in: a-proteobacteria)]